LAGKAIGAMVAVFRTRARRMYVKAAGLAFKAFVARVVFVITLHVLLSFVFTVQMNSSTR